MIIPVLSLGMYVLRVKKKRREKFIPLKSVFSTKHKDFSIIDCAQHQMLSLLWNIFYFSRF